MNWYVLPDGNVQIAFSGGRTSAYLLRQLLDANGGIPDRCVVTFQNTARERGETLDFVQEVGERWRVDVRWLEWRPSPDMRNPFSEPDFADKYREIFGGARFERMADWWLRSASVDKYAVVNHATAARAGEVFEALVLGKRYLPNQQMRFCTIEMKVRTAKRYLMSIGWDRWTNAVGLRADERHRLNKPPPKDRWTVWHPLATAGIGRADIVRFWSGQPFDLRLPNIKGNCWLGNCDGCFLKSEANIAAFTRDYPQDAAWWEGMEQLVGWMTNSASAAFWSKRYSRHDMRRYMARQGDWALNTDGALCQTDEGECTA